MPRPGSWRKEDYRARCPLHIAYKEDGIMCQPAMPDCAITIHRFSDAEKGMRQIRIFCCGCYERCEHYRAWKHFMWEDEDDG